MIFFTSERTALFLFVAHLYFFTKVYPKQKKINNNYDDNFYYCVDYKPKDRGKIYFSDLDSI
jgi:hypothetical protein